MFCVWICKDYLWARGREKRFAVGICADLLELQAHASDGTDNTVSDDELSIAEKADGCNCCCTFK